MNGRTLKLLASVAALAAVPATSIAQVAPVPVPAQAVALPTAGAVAAVYNQHSLSPVWFRGGKPSVAVTQLAQILRRAPLDGLASGPQLAEQVQAAVLRAASGNTADISAAEQLLSSAWVLYVQTIKRPTPGMIYAYDVLKPQGARPDQILLTTAGAPSLEQYIAQVASVNPIYASIRDAEWARMQASGSTTPDPRVVANLDRVRSLPARSRFLLVDSATQRLFLYDNGVPVDSMKIIVGTDDLPTPLIASVMYYVTFNPYWNAPDHLVRKAIAPNVLSQGQKYLKTRGYNVMTDWTRNASVVPPDQVDWKSVRAGKTHVRVRQDPGPGNFMGELKFTFPNPEDIFLHDTPRKDLFAESNRALSNGCVRVEDAKRLGRWLLGREPVAPGVDPETQVQLQQGVPIYLTYITAQVADGKLTFVKDVYGWDRPGAAEMAAAAMAASRVERN